MSSAQICKVPATPSGRPAKIFLAISSIWSRRDAKRRSRSPDAIWRQPLISCSAPREIAQAIGLPSISISNDMPLPSHRGFPVEGGFLMMFMECLSKIVTAASAVFSAGEASSRWGAARRRLSAQGVGTQRKYPGLR